MSGDRERVIPDELSGERLPPINPLDGLKCCTICGAIVPVEYWGVHLNWHGVRS